MRHLGQDGRESSNTELLTCLEMARDVRVLRSTAAARSEPTKPASSLSTPTAPATPTEAAAPTEAAPVVSPASRGRSSAATTEKDLDQAKGEAERAKADAQVAKASEALAQRKLADAEAGLRRVREEVEQAKAEAERAKADAQGARESEAAVKRKLADAETARVAAEKRHARAAIQHARVSVGDCGGGWDGLPLPIPSRGYECGHLLCVCHPPLRLRAPPTGASCASCDDKIHGAKNKELHSRG